MFIIDYNNLKMIIYITDYLFVFIIDYNNLKWLFINNYYRLFIYVYYHLIFNPFTPSKALQLLGVSEYEKNNIKDIEQ